jgi:hypothetical protein
MKNHPQIQVSSIDGPSARKTSCPTGMVLKLSPKMYKFHEWYMRQSAKGVHSIGMLATPKDFATEGNKVV